jgi:hypothetical protein
MFQSILMLLNLHTMLKGDNTTILNGNGFKAYNYMKSTQNYRIYTIK